MKRLWTISHGTKKVRINESTIDTLHKEYTKNIKYFPYMKYINCFVYDYLYNFYSKQLYNGTRAKNHEESVPITLLSNYVWQCMIHYPFASSLALIIPSDPIFIYTPYLLICTITLNSKDLHQDYSSKISRISI